MRSLSRRAGFTLVELIVTIAIIAVLAGLTIAAIGQFGAAGDRQRTEATLQVLAAAVDAFEKESGRTIIWGTTRNDQPGADMHADVPHVFSATQLLTRIERSPAARELLAGLSPSLLFRYDSEDETTPAWLEFSGNDDPNGDAIDSASDEYDDGLWDGFLAVLDAWGQPVRAVHPGPDWEQFRNLASAPVRDQDGTVQLNDDFMGAILGVEYQSTEDVYGIATGRTIFFVSAGPDGRFGRAIDEPDGFAADNIWSGPVIRPGGQDG